MILLFLLRGLPQLSVFHCRLFPRPGMALSISKLNLYVVSLILIQNWKNIYWVSWTWILNVQDYCAHTVTLIIEASFIRFYAFISIHVLYTAVILWLLLPSELFNFLSISYHDLIIGLSCVWSPHFEHLPPSLIPDCIPSTSLALLPLMLLF
jgi:hypothetical protein